MNKYLLSISLQTTPEEVARLAALQQAFAEVCNALAPTVRETRCWNRVTLHHLTYRSLRDRFPQLGSQMICNAIYSVSRNCRLVFQTPQSPFFIDRLVNKPLPLVKYLPSAPVYFDRHTLSVRKGVLSMFTMNGRMRFQLSLSEKDEQRFIHQKLQEIVLLSTGNHYRLDFCFVDGEETEVTAPNVDAEWPEYLVIAEKEDMNISPIDTQSIAFTTSSTGIRT